MSTVFQKIEFQESSRNVYILQEVNCIPGVSRGSGHPANLPKQLIYQYIFFQLLSRVVLVCICWY